jgi:hypothetical protein
MEKTAKITRTVFKNVWNNPKGGQVFYHDIELDNGDKGSIGSKEQMPVKLNPGSDLTYIIEGSKIKAFVAPQQSGGATFQKKPQTDPRIQMIGFAMSYAKDLVIADKIKIDSLAVQFDIIYNEMISKI